MANAFVRTLSWTPIALSVGAALLTAACGEKALGTAPGQLAPAPLAEPAARTVAPVPVEIRETLVVTGTIGSKQTSNIGPLVAGVVEKIFVGVGDRVKAGDPLFQTRPEDYERGVAEAKAKFAVAAARLANAKQIFSRTKSLFDEGFAPQARLDSAQAELDVAKSDVDLRRAELATAQQKLEDTTVRAPFDGAITKRFNDEGVYMSNSFRTGPETTVLQIQENHIVVAVVRAPESALEKVKLGQEARVFVEGQSQARKSSVYVVNDMLDLATRTIELRLPFENPDFSVKSGQFARAEIDIGARAALALPREAVREDAGGAYVMLLKEGVARRTTVEIQPYDAGRVAILSGLSPDDTVILPGAVPVKDGDRVSAGDV